MGGSRQDIKRRHLANLIIDIAGKRFEKKYSSFSTLSGVLLKNVQNVLI